MRILAIDLGDRRTGLAAGDSTTGIATPLEVIECPAGETLVEAIVERVQRHEPDEIVVGLPLNMDGTEGEPARRARGFGRTIEEATGLPVRFQDERLTSYEADQTMARSGRTHKQKKRVRDALAAATILRDYLEREER
ncbi:MAG: Holliday junction resolvase RuvX [Planctomycetota bacterium]